MPHAKHVIEVIGPVSIMRIENTDVWVAIDTMGHRCGIGPDPDALAKAVEARHAVDVVVNRGR